MKDETRREAAELISEIYAALLGTGSWQTFLDRLSRLLPNGKSTLFYHDVAAGKGEHTLHSRFDPDSLAAYKSYYSARNPFMQRAVARPLGLGVRAEQMLPREDLRKTEFYADYLRPQGLETAVGVTVFREQGRHFLLSTACALADDARIRSVATLMGLLAPHLRQAFACYGRARGPLAGRIAVDAASEALGVAIVSIGLDRRVRWSNPAGLTLLSSGDPIGTNACGRIATPHIEVRHAIDVALAAAARGEAAVRTGVVVPARDETMPPTRMALVVPALSSSERYFSGPCIVLLFESATPGEPPAEDVLRSVFGLTPSEARVARALAGGAALADAAAAHGIAKETARTHLKRIFAKMDVRRQSELVAKIHRAAKERR